MEHMHHGMGMDITHVILGAAAMLGIMRLFGYHRLHDGDKDK